MTDIRELVARVRRYLNPEMVVDSFLAAYEEEMRRADENSALANELGRRLEEMRRERDRYKRRLERIVQPDILRADNERLREALRAIDVGYALSAPEMRDRARTALAETQGEPQRMEMTAS
jgi:hypothetical protein